MIAGTLKPRWFELIPRESCVLRPTSSCVLGVGDFEMRNFSLVISLAVSFLAGDGSNAVAQAKKIEPLKVEIPLPPEAFSAIKTGQKVRVPVIDEGTGKQAIEKGVPLWVLDPKTGTPVLVDQVKKDKDGNVIRNVGFSLTLQHKDRMGFVRVTTTAGFILERGENAFWEVSKDGKTLSLVVPNPEKTSTVGIDTALNIESVDGETSAGEIPALNLPGKRMDQFSVQFKVKTATLKSGSGGTGFPPK